MSAEIQRLLAAMAGQVFADAAAAGGEAAPLDGWSPALWQTLEQVGLARIGVAEERGGDGADLAAAALVVRLAAHHAAPVPLAETALVAGWLLEHAGIDCPRGPLTAAFVRDGQAQAVPFARQAAAIAVLTECTGELRAGLAEPGGYEIVAQGANVAGEPRDRVAFGSLDALPPAPASLSPAALADRWALARTIQLAGAQRRILDLTTAYAAVRRQFGTPIARFQAVQQMLAAMAGEVEATDAAVEAVLAQPTPLWIAVAKLRASEAAGIVATLAHQVHGAIGFTQEHPLHQLTRRAWAWRDEGGSEVVHARAIGSALLGQHPGEVWKWITAEPGAQIA